MVSQGLGAGEPGVPARVFRLLAATGTHPVSTATTAGAGCGGPSLSCPPPKAGRLCPEGHAALELTLSEEQNVPRAPEPSQDQDKPIHPWTWTPLEGSLSLSPRQGAGEVSTFTG